MLSEEWRALQDIIATESPSILDLIIQEHIPEPLRPYEDQTRALFQRVFWQAIIPCSSGSRTTDETQPAVRIQAIPAEAMPVKRRETADCSRQAVRQMPRTANISQTSVRAIQLVILSILVCSNRPIHIFTQRYPNPIFSMVISGCSFMPASEERRLQMLQTMPMVLARPLIKTSERNTPVLCLTASYLVRVIAMHTEMDAVGSTWRCIHNCWNILHCCRFAQKRIPCHSSWPSLQQLCCTFSGFIYILFLHMLMNILIISSYKYIVNRTIIYIFL